uniref:Uncharacterized protein n=1 Tax=Arundo donax TaxID=35708 RepID=A0A0A9FIZ4_ARUDO
MLLFTISFFSLEPARHILSSIVYDILVSTIFEIIMILFLVKFVPFTL